LGLFGVQGEVRYALSDANATAAVEMEREENIGDGKTETLANLPPVPKPELWFLVRGNGSKVTQAEESTALDLT
jgi:hypothetical protein